MRSLQVELQSFGLRSMPAAIARRSGGAGPAEGCTFFIGGRALTVPVNSPHVQSSPYELLERGEALLLHRNDTAVAEIEIRPRPRFYDDPAGQGRQGSALALLHGADCLASTVYQNCVYWGTDLACAFCGIGLSLARGATTLEKNPLELGAVARRAALLDGARHVTLTTGMHADERQTAEHLARCAQSIKAASGLPVHVQLMPPRDLRLLESLRQAGVDTIGFHLETGDPRVLERVAPAKATLGMRLFREAFGLSVELFGKNQVSSFLIAGLGEIPETMLGTAEELCACGVFPYVLPLRPIPGTPMEKELPPGPGVMSALYEQVAKMLGRYGLSSAACKAGCVRCGACSCLALFERDS